MAKHITPLLAFTLLALFVCGAAKPGAFVQKQTPADSVYTSPIRPGERLTVGKIYTDSFEYLDYNDEGDNLLINVIKDGKAYSFIADALSAAIVADPQFSAGDLLEIDWRIDFLTSAGDSEVMSVEKFAGKITKSNHAMKTEKAIILEETAEQTRYLTALTRLVRKSGDEPNVYAGGDELFLRYETRTVPKDDTTRSMRQRAVLHCVPERIERAKGGSVDTYVFEVLLESAGYYKDGKPETHASPSWKWSRAGDYTDGGIHAKILHYYFNNKAAIPVQQEDLGKYGK